MILDVQCESKNPLGDMDSMINLQFREGDMLYIIQKVHVCIAIGCDMLLNLLGSIVNNAS